MVTAGVLSDNNQKNMSKYTINQGITAIIKVFKEVKQKRLHSTVISFYLLSLHLIIDEAVTSDWVEKTIYEENKKGNYIVSVENINAPSWFIYNH